MSQSEIPQWSEGTHLILCQGEDIYHGVFRETKEGKAPKKQNKVGRMVMVPGTPDQLIYYLEYFLLEEPEQAARRTLSKLNITAAEW